MTNYIEQLCVFACDHSPQGSLKCDGKIDFELSEINSNKYGLMCCICDDGLFPQRV